jgi:dihydrofolate synthase / folylpolyglutamate synthase
MAQFKKYFNAVDYLETLAASQHDQAYMHNRNNNPQQYVERTRELIKLLGNPHRGFRFIHISGTSGKGSTVGYLHNMIRKSGLKVGSFTSPYASTSIEKIEVNDKLIDPNVFVKLVDKVKPAIEKMSGKEGSGSGRDKPYKYGRPSYFEIFFALAILYFRKMKCEYVILEVGCGGTYDAGMIVPKAITATTNVGLDHTHLLGNTLSKIAKEKAGIIRKNSHFFTTEKRPKILKIFKSICKKQHTKFHIVKGRHMLKIQKESPSASTQSTLNGSLAHASLLYQNKNADLAASIAKHLKINDNIINDAIDETTLPCRFEIIQKNPLVILDGAHNPDKIRNVVHNLKYLTYDRLYTMFASGTTKNACTMIKQLGKVTNEFVFTTVKGKGRAFYKPNKLALFGKTFKNKSTESNPKKALARVLNKLKKNDALLIAGSFYLTGELRKHWISENKILNKRTHV